MELTVPEKHIKNTSTCGAILIENKLETGEQTLVQPRLYGRPTQNQVGREEKWSGQDLHI